jgi:uncharacterized Zn finger protein
MATIEKECPNCGTLCDFHGNTEGESTMQCIECGYFEEHFANAHKIVAHVVDKPYGVLHVDLKEGATIYLSAASKKQCNELVDDMKPRATSIYLQRYADGLFTKVPIYLT